MKRLLALALSMCMILGLLIGCGSTNQPDNGGAADTGGDETGKFLVSILLNKTNAPYPAAMLKTIEEHQNDWEDVEFRVYDAQADVTMQAQQVDEAIAAESDAIILHPVDSTACVALSKKVHDAGIYCINMAVFLSDDTYLDAQCGPDIRLGARMAADEMHKVFPDGCNYVLVTCDFSNDNARIRAEEFEQYSEEMGYNFNLLATSPDCAWQSEKAKIYTNDLLSRYPGEIDAIYPADDTMGYGALQAIQEDTSGLNSDIKIFSPSGGIEGVLEALASGDSNYHSTVYLAARDDALNAMTTAAEMLHGDMPEEKFIPFPIYTVTAENVSEFTEPAF